MFEKTSFLVIASSQQHQTTSSSTDLTHTQALKLDPKRYNRTSEIIKTFKYSCSFLRKEFQSLEIEMENFTAVLDEMTRTSYILVVVHDKTIETEAIKMNIRLARPKFEELQRMDTADN